MQRHVAWLLADPPFTQRTFRELPAREEGNTLAPWLAALASLICRFMVGECRPGSGNAWLAHPFWFQAFGAVMGMDWHSSGITTSVIGALKRGLEPIQDELGVYVCGGRGRHSRKTPDALLAVAERTGMDGAARARTSRLVAKVDSAAVQDGFDLGCAASWMTRTRRWRGRAAE